LPRKSAPKTELEVVTYKVDTSFYDFRNFLAYVWQKLGLSKPSASQLDIALYLQGGVYLRNGERSPTDQSDYSKNTNFKIVQAWRGLGKTWITATYACWILYLDPNQKIIIVSAAEDHALKVLYFIRQLFDKIDILKPLIPTKGCRDSLNQGIDVAPTLSNPTVQPSIYCTGINSSLPGNRANLIIGDDIETPKNSKSDKTREDLLGQIGEFKNIIVENGKVILLGTAHFVDSIYFTDLIEKESYDLKIWPVRIPTQEQRANPNYEQYLGGHIKNLIKLGVPDFTAHDDRWTEEFINSKKLPLSQFMLQFMLDTNISDTLTYPLKLSDMIVMPLDLEKVPEYIVWGNTEEEKLNFPTAGLKGDFYYKPAATSEHYTKYNLRIMAIDPSGKGNNRTGYVILFESNSKLFLMDAGGLLGGYEDSTLLELVMIAKKYQVNGIIVEPNFGGGMFTRLLTPILHRNYHCLLKESEFSSSNKEQRIIDTLEPVFNQHRMVVDRNLVIKDARETERNHQLFRQITRINRIRGGLSFDDVIDALSIGVAYMSNRLGTQDLFLVHKREQKEYDRVYDKLLGRNFLGTNPKTNPNFLGDNW
jgi:hypothetical protein